MRASKQFVNVGVKVRNNLQEQYAMTIHSPTKEENEPHDSTTTALNTEKCVSKSGNRLATKTG